MSIETTLDNLQYVLQNTDDVYSKGNLGSRINAVTYNERTSLNKYNQNKTNSKNTRLSNWASLLHEQTNLNDSNLKLVNESKDIFVNDFNKNTITIDKLNHEISTKNQIIMMNSYNEDSKSMLINAMKSVILYLVIMLIPFILMIMGVITYGTGISFIVFFGIITLVVILYNYYMARRDNVANDIIKKSRDTAQNFVKLFNKDETVPAYYEGKKKCPTKCHQRPKPIPEEENVTPDYSAGANEVWLSNDSNMWRDGDIPSVGATVRGNKALGKDVEPKPYYKGDKNTPTYKCRWKGDPTKRTDMNNGDLEFMTTIPCEFYPGYETVSKVQ